ncbi:MAG: hypothetical protein WBB77_01290 [Candidatus Nanopelagicales bacterium]
MIVRSAGAVPLPNTGVPVAVSPLLVSVADGALLVVAVGVLSDELLSLLQAPRTGVIAMTAAANTRLLRLYCAILVIGLPRLVGLVGSDGR